MFDDATIVAEIPARWQMNPSYMHSFAITENYFIIIEQPLKVYFDFTNLNRTKCPNTFHLCNKSIFFNFLTFFSNLDITGWINHGKILETAIGFNFQMVSK